MSNRARPRSAGAMGASRPRASSVAELARSALLALMALACAIPPGAHASSHDDVAGPQAVAVDGSVRLVAFTAFKDVDPIWGDYSPSALSTSFAKTTWATQLDRTTYANLTNLADAESLTQCADPSAFSEQHINDTHVPNYVINTTLTCHPALWGTGVTAGYTVETRYDAPTLDIAVEVNDADASVRMRSGDPRVTDSSSGAMISYLNADVTDGWVNAVNATDHASGTVRNASGVALLMDGQHPTLVEIEVTSGDGGNDRRATYWLLVTKNDEEYTCPGRDANPLLTQGVDTMCLGAESVVDPVPSVVQIQQTTTLLVQGKDGAGLINTNGGEAKGIEVKIQHYWESYDYHLNLITNYGMETYGTAEDLGNGNYTVAFSPGKSGLFFFSVSFWGVPHTVEQRFRVEPRKALPVDYIVTSPVLDVNDASKGSAVVEEIVDFTVRAGDGLEHVFDDEAQITATIQYFGVGAASGGLNRTDWMATMGYRDQHDLYREPVPTPLVISRDDAAGERYFKFAKTVAGQYEIHVKLGAAHLGDSPYTIHVKGGPPVNYASTKGLTTIVYNGVRPSDSSDQLSSFVEGATNEYAAGTEVSMDIDLRDRFGNVATIDTQNRELLVKFQDTNGNGGGGDDFVIASVERNFEGTVADPGYNESGLPI